MTKNGFGRVINMSPPIRLDILAGHTAYYISKFGMTLVALGVAAEYAGTGITANTIWPATVIESLASINFKLGDKSNWRKPTIITDCVLAVINEPDSFTGQESLFKSIKK
jgi:NAD(P)-dependent dehydrogenase (short-subunit alcohol dehydrogenase family)